MGVVVSFCTPEKIDSVVSLTALLQFFLTIQGNLIVNRIAKSVIKIALVFFIGLM